MNRLTDTIRFLKRGVGEETKRGKQMLVNILAVIGGITVVIGIVWVIMKFIKPVKFRGYDDAVYTPDEADEKQE